MVPLHCGYLVWGVGCRGSRGWPSHTFHDSALLPCQSQPPPGSHMVPLHCGYLHPLTLFTILVCHFSRFRSHFSRHLTLFSFALPQPLPPEVAWPRCTAHTCINTQFSRFRFLATPQPLFGPLESCPPGSHMGPMHFGRLHPESSSGGTSHYFLPDLFLHIHVKILLIMLIGEIRKMSLISKTRLIRESQHNTLSSIS